MSFYYIDPTEQKNTPIFCRDIWEKKFDFGQVEKNSL